MPWVAERRRRYIAERFNPPNDWGKLGSRLSECGVTCIHPAPSNDFIEVTSSREVEVVDARGRELRGAEDQLNTVAIYAGDWVVFDEPEVRVITDGQFRRRYEVVGE